MRARGQGFDVTTTSKKGVLRKTAVFGAGECTEALRRGTSPDDATSAITSQLPPIQETYEDQIARILEINGIAGRSLASQKMLSQVDQLDMQFYGRPELLNQADSSYQQS